MLPRTLPATLTLSALASPGLAQVTLPDGSPDPGYADFYAWYDATDGVNGPGQPADQAAVTSWVDRTGNGRDLVRTDADPARHATFVAQALTGNAAVGFDGNDYLWADKVAEFGSLAGAKTVFVVARADLADGGYVFDSQSVSGRNALFTGQSSSPGKWNVFAGSPPATVGPDVEHGRWRVHTVEFEPGRNRLYLDGLEVALGVVPTASLDGLILGSRYSVTMGLTGAIAELLVYSEVLAPADRLAIEKYLMLRYALPVGLTADVDQLSLLAGGEQKLALSAGPPWAGLLYLLVGSASGTSPGTVVSGSGLLLPLNVDAYTLYTVAHPNQAPLSGSFGVLDGTGQGGAAFQLLNAPYDPGLAGLALHHAYLAFEVTPTLVRAIYASNAVPVTLVP